MECVCVCKYSLFPLTDETGENEMYITRAFVCMWLQILLLKQKLRAYEEQKIPAPALNPVSGQKRGEFQK